MHDTSKLDWKNLKEEIETMGRSERRELASLLDVLLIHLLKNEFQPEGKGNSKSWEKSIYNARKGIEKLLDDSPSLKPVVEQILPKLYENAVRYAVIETGLLKSDFPTFCPWNIEFLLKE
jgi:hypothetical protein